jgi:hypothetical protein
MTRTLRRVLLACALSNGAFAAIGLNVLGHETVSAVAAGHAPKTTKNEQTATSLTIPPATTDTTSTQPSPTASSPRTPSKRTSSSTRTPSTTPAAAVNDVTGIMSSTAPPTSSRISPDAGSYPAAFNGSASVNGRGQSVPSSGSVVFVAAGSDLKQTAPHTPGDVSLTQRFSAAKASLVSFQMKAGDTTKVFNPSSPVTFVMYNAPQGTTWNWSATSTEGATRVNATGSVAGQQTMNVAGEDVAVTQVTTTLSLSGDITGSAEITAWVSPSYRLPLMQRQVINAKTQSGYGFSTRLVSDVTQTLTALKPS